MNKRKLAEALLIASLAVAALLAVLGFWYPPLNTAALLLIVATIVLLERTIRFRIASERAHRWRLLKRVALLEEAVSDQTPAGDGSEAEDADPGSAEDDEEAQQYLRLAPIYARISNLEDRVGRRD